MATWFTSDQHYGHAGILKPTMHCRRDLHFSSVEDMDRAMVERWNEVVGPNDEVWCLGDFAYRCSEEYAKGIFNSLNGGKHLVKGNHEKLGVRMPWLSQQDYKELTVDGQRLVLFHYGLRVWNQMRRGSLHLYGHSHGTLVGCSQSLDVGVDCWNFRPVSLDEIRARMATLPPAYPEGGQDADENALAECA